MIAFTPAMEGSRRTGEPSGRERRIPLTYLKPKNPSLMGLCLAAGGV
jgi:hypothetical protein